MLRVVILTEGNGYFNNLKRKAVGTIRAKLKGVYFEEEPKNSPHIILKTILFLIWRVTRLNEAHYFYIKTTPNVL